jgi:hypothetical protein
MILVLPNHIDQVVMKRLLVWDTLQGVIRMIWFLTIQTLLVQVLQIAGLVIPAVAVGVKKLMRQILLLERVEAVTTQTKRCVYVEHHYVR